MNIDSVHALIRLMDDPDDHVYSHVYDQLKSYGSAAIPYLETSWEEQDFGLIFQQRVEQLIHEIQFENSLASLQQWIDSDDKNLLEGAIIVAKYQYPGLSVEKIHRQIEEIRGRIWLEISESQTAFEKVKIFNHIFFDLFNFHGNSKNFHAPLNSYINTVLELKTGNPLSLSIVYSIVAQQLKMPVFGVNLPNHFILAYLDENNTNGIVNPTATSGVLFYINPFSKGGTLKESDIHTFLKQINTEPKRGHFEPCGNTQIILRMIINLIAAFQRAGNAEKVTELVQLRNLFL